MPVAKKTTTGYFVISRLGTSVHRKGAFESRDAAIEWVSKNYAGQPCWLVAAEYIGTTPHKPLGADGYPVQEG